MVYVQEKAKKINVMCAAIAAFVFDFENKLRDEINQELIDEKNRNGVIDEDRQKLLLRIKGDAIIIAEDLRVQAFDRARKMVTEGIQDDKNQKQRQK